MGKVKIDISVIICTSNRCDGLRASLDAVFSQVYNGFFNYEVIIVDNNSKDRTKEAVGSFVAKFNGRLKYVFEPKQGLGYARNTGIREAKGEVVVFTDDDCIPSRTWLRNIYEEYKRDNSLAVLTGKTSLLNENSAPLSIKNDEQRLVFKLPCDPWDIGHGNNFAVKKGLFAKIGAFDVLLGAGTCIGSAEDTDFFYRALKNKFKISYVPDVIMYHNHNRITPSGISKIEYNYAKGRGAFYIKNIMSFDKFASQLLYWEVNGLLHKYLETKERDKETAKKVKMKIRGMLNGIIYMAAKLITRLYIISPENKGK